MEEEEGPRMRQLRAVFGKALDKSTSSFEKIPIKKIYPTCTKEQQKSIKKITKELFKSMRTNMEREFDQIVEQTNVCKQLNTLDKLIVQQSENAKGQRRPVIGPNPMETLQQKILDIKMAKCKALEKKLAQYKKEIEALEVQKEKLDLQDKENSEHLEKILDRVSSVSADVKN